MSSSSSRAVSMMIGTARVARSRLQTSSPSSFGSMMSSTTRSIRLGGEALERLLAVGRLHDGVAVPLEREREHLADGVLVVDEQDRGGGVGHGLSGACRGSSPDGCGPGSYYSPGMTATPRPVRRRRPRRGSLERPVNGRLYRSAFLVLSLPLLILAFSVTRPAPLPAPAPAAELRRAGDGDDPRDRLREALPRPRRRAAPGRSAPPTGSATRCALRPAGRVRHLARSACPGSDASACRTSGRSPPASRPTRSS